MVLKKIGYYISKGKCLKAYKMKKMNKRTKRMVTKRVNYRGKILKKGTKVFKNKRDCEKMLKKMMKKTQKKETKSKAKRSKAKHSKRSKFGQECYYSAPYFGNFVPLIANVASGTQNTGITSRAWAMPTPPGAKAIDMQQGGWRKY